MIGQTRSTPVRFASACSTTTLTARPFHIPLSRNDRLAHVSRTQVFKSPLVHERIGETKPILLVRSRIGSGTNPSIAVRSTRFVTPPPILLVSGSEKP